MSLATSPIYVKICRAAGRDLNLNYSEETRLDYEFMASGHPDELSPWARAIFDMARGIEVKEIPPVPTGPLREPMM